MKILKAIIFFLYLIFLTSCNKDETDQELLKKDQLALEESLKSEAISKYKFLKIALRSSVPMENYPKEFEPFKEKLNDLTQNIASNSNKKELSVFEIASLYKDYLDIKEVIDKMDEDDFPTLNDLLEYSNNKNQAIKLLSGNEKKETEGYEHALMSVLTLAGKDAGTDLTMYELSKIKPENITEKEVKAIFQLNRGVLFFSKNLYYLSENELSNNINWLNENKNINIPIINLIFGWNNLNKEKNYLAFHSLNHLFRGLDRSRMEREIDETRSIEDFQQFLDDTEKIGFSNELVWCISAYVNIKKENPDKAIEALTKLKSSPLISDNDKKDIEKTIEYLKNRESGKVINGVYDKVFIGKIAMSFVYDKLSKVDWERVFIENNIKHGENILGAINQLKAINQKIQDIKDLKYLEEGKNKIEKEGKNIWDKAKDLIK